MAKANPSQLTAKYQDDETKGVYYGYRFYNASTGRWLSRDPAEEEGGLDLYSACENDCLERFDPLGLKWNIMRVSSGAKAPAWCDCGDTFADLARTVGLDVVDYRAWANTTDELPTPNQIYLIPNTIYIDYGEMFKWNDGMGPIPAWRNWLREAADIYRWRGFKVVETDPSNPDPTQQHLRSHDIYGFAYAGHGGGNGATPAVVGVLVFHGGEGNSTYLDGARYTHYGLNFVDVFGCSTAKQFPNDARRQMALHWKYSPWEKNVATVGTVLGIWGEVNGYQAWSHLIGTTGTNHR